ncbi:UDP-glucose 4-epimerase GalE [Kribbella speibonae]|uniref:UDP-glucose 4-epimerase n=1 Tax=Kribbella speibonae TaxID=1572660 RepID=A0A4R0IU92_9ACTN|nr:UDP-glucose 4-epimerase GalE [Kribbella speibonae]TCC36320.1 UDP-glucose 4-epimerase GalE [Kribbella speibonae]
MKVLISGGAGFIGSTIANACRDRGISTVILDDCSTGDPSFAEGHPFYMGDIADGDLIDQIMQHHPDVGVVVHCAAKVIVPESVENPLDYYETNVSKSLAFLRHLTRNGVSRLVFSSSASVYASTNRGVVDEGSAIRPSSPYAVTKAVFERVLEDSANANILRAIALRYFNPIGADPLLRSGVQHPDPPHALGLLIKCASEKGSAFTIAGTDWPTRDGSAIRDYVHVWDLAEAHVSAIQRFDSIVRQDVPFHVINIGTGTGVTVRELVDAVGRVTGAQLKVLEGTRRLGDSTGASADGTRAKELLEWEPILSLDDAVIHAMAWADRRRQPRM